MDPSTLNAYPTTYNFCKTIREYEKSKPEEELGMSDNGRVMSKEEFFKEFGQTDKALGWAKSWVLTVRDPEGKTFADYQSNMEGSLNTYVERTHLTERGIKFSSIERLTPSGLKPFVEKLEESAKTPFSAGAKAYEGANNLKLPGLPSLREGDYNHLMTYLESGLSEKFAPDFATPANKRALFQELCSINKGLVKELATRVSSSYRDSEQESSIQDMLTMELSTRRKTVATSLLEAQLKNFPDKDKVTTRQVKGQPVETMKEQSDFAAPLNPAGLSLQELQDLDYQVTTSAALLKDELAENKQRAQAQGNAEQFDEKTHGKFQALLDDPNKLGRCEYLYSFKTASQELPATGIAGADGNVSYGMEDVPVAQHVHTMIAGHWTPVRITAVLDGHTVDNRKDTGDNSAATESGKNLPEALTKRLNSLNQKTFTKTGMTAACQAAIVDLDRQGNYQSGGSTLNCAAVIGNHLCIINTGDSRSLFINPDKAPSDAGACIQLSEDAGLLNEQDNPDNAKSRFNKMVHERGGIVAPHPKKPSQVRVKCRDTPEGDNGMSCVTSIGDHNYNGVTSPRPFVTVFDENELDPSGFLVQFSDGISEVATNEQITRLVKRLCTEKPDISPENLAASIRDHAFRAGSKDNLVVIVTRVRDLFKPPQSAADTSGQPA
ncbi:PP2C family serine/threonine-protein phosphatase [Endozoicomonas lisbonensis]|uniref:Serine/threonine protein phosphatase PrpC n=1 Tax=Endozoicomonas lisbonensis TaxID=3120522 RepID=A0ABV2SKI2_9GAMM